MYCTNCGHSLPEESRFCSECGKPAGSSPAPQRPAERLVRVRQGKKIAGVCGGFARYLGVDATLTSGRFCGTRHGFESGDTSRRRVVEHHQTIRDAAQLCQAPVPIDRVHQQPQADDDVERAIRKVELVRITAQHSGGAIGERI